MAEVPSRAKEKAPALPEVCLLRGHVLCKMADCPVARAEGVWSLAGAEGTTCAVVADSQGGAARASTSAKNSTNGI